MFVVPHKLGGYVVIASLPCLCSDKPSSSHCSKFLMCWKRYAVRMQSPYMVRLWHDDYQLYTNSPFISDAVARRV